LSPETCRDDLKRLIKEYIVASCWLLTSLYDYCQPQHNLQDSISTKEKINRGGVVAVVQFAAHDMLNDVDPISTYSSSRNFQIFT
jgi:hypothetical protein